MRRSRSCPGLPPPSLQPPCTSPRHPPCRSTCRDEFSPQFRSLCKPEIQPARQRLGSTAHNGHPHFMPRHRAIVVRLWHGVLKALACIGNPVRPNHRAPSAAGTWMERAHIRASAHWPRAVEPPLVRHDPDVFFVAFNCLSAAGERPRDPEPGDSGARVCRRRDAVLMPAASGEHVAAAANSAIRARHDAAQLARPGAIGFIGHAAALNPEVRPVLDGQRLPLARTPSA